MKNYEYEATILEVDERNRVMTVLYTSPGRMDIPCGVALPESAEDLGDAIHLAVPWGVWHEQERTVFVPLIGTQVKGTVRLGAQPALESDPVSPSLPFMQPTQPAGGGEGAPASAPQAPGGFPTRYVGAESSGQVQTVNETVPEVVL